MLSGKTGSDSIFTNKCTTLLKKILDSKKILITTSCTHALEMAIRIININIDDEVIMPSYTFPSTANAVLLNNGKIVFTEINPKDMCIDVDRIEEKITTKTRAIIVVHYGGNSCDMDRVMEIANRYNLFVIEDAAQGFLSEYKGKMLGTIGHFGCFSFHETKNISCGEGGAISINISESNKSLVENINTADYIRDKGTNKSEFINGLVSFYQLVDVGSSYCPSEILMAYLYAQLENISIIQQKRSEIFNAYHSHFSIKAYKEIEFYAKGNLYGKFNSHIFYLVFNKENKVREFIKKLKDFGIDAFTHFVPLHISVMGKKLGYSENDFLFEASIYKRLVRLPIHSMMDKEQLEYILNTIDKIL